MKIIRLVVLILFLSTQLLACSERDWDEGVEAYKRGDYAVALVKWRPLAEQGRNNAQYWLGQMYYKGHGVSQDDKEAAKWYRKAAEQGHPYAQDRLGIMYTGGRGVPQDIKEAIKWFRKAAEQGYVPAQYNLGSLYYNGQGVAQDYKEAIKWLRKAAEQGSDEAQYRLAAMYAQGQGVTKGNKEAVKWCRKAAEQGHVGAQKRLGAMFYYGSYDLAQDYKEAMMWYRKAAEQGDTEAQNILGIMYGSGYGVQQDYVQAYMWCSIAGENGYESGSRNRDLAASQMTPVQIADAQRLAREWMERHPYLTKLEATPNQSPTQDVDQALDHLPDRVPGGTLADVILQRDIINHIALWNAFNGNKGFQGAVLNTRLLTPSPELISEKSRESLETYTNIAVRHGQEPPEWAREEWMINRNGMNVYYEIILIESYAGGIDILMGRVQEVPFSD